MFTTIFQIKGYGVNISEIGLNADAYFHYETAKNVSE